MHSQGLGVKGTLKPGKDSRYFSFTLMGRISGSSSTVGGRLSLPGLLWARQRDRPLRGWYVRRFRSQWGLKAALSRRNEERGPGLWTCRKGNLFRQPGCGLPFPLALPLPRCSLHSQASLLQGPWHFPRLQNSGPSHFHSQ